MKRTAGFCICTLVALVMLLPACGDDEGPTEPKGTTPPADDLVGTYELLDFREWGYVESMSGGGGWGPPGTRTTFDRSPASFGSHSGEMSILSDGDSLLYTQVFVEDGDSVRNVAGMWGLTYTNGTEEGRFAAVVGFSGRTVTFKCDGMELRFDYDTVPIGDGFVNGGESTRWEIWKKVSDEAVPLF